MPIEKKRAERISANEAAKVLGVQPQRLRLWLLAGKFKSARKDFGTRWSVLKSEVITMRRENRNHA